MGTLSEELVDAAHRGDLDLIAELSVCGHDLQGECKEGSDLLYHFVWQNCDARGLQRLISLGCIPQNKDTAGGTPLTAAVWCKSPEMVEMLLSAGANPNTIAFLGDDEFSALDSVIDDYCDCVTKEEVERMMHIEILVRKAGGKMRSLHPNSGRFTNLTCDGRAHPGDKSSLL
jgi:hypothetical protein